MATTAPPTATAATRRAARQPPRIISRPRRAVEVLGPSGIVFSHAFWAAWNLAPSGFRPLPILTCAPPLASNCGSGKSMPCSRMQRALASAAFLNSSLSSEDISGALIWLRYFAHAFSAARILSGLPPFIRWVTRPPLNCGSGMSTPFLRMQRARSSIALRFLASWVWPAAGFEGSSSAPQATSEAVAARATRSETIFIEDISPGGHETAFSRT